MATELNSSTFKAEIGKAGLMIVDFWAPRCAACLKLAPILAELSKDYQGKMRFCEINTEHNKELADKNDVMGIPCLIIFSRGKEIGRIVGAMDKERIKAKIEAILTQAKQKE